MGLARGGAEQVVAAGHLVDPGRGVVDHDGEVVGDHAVAAAQHEVVDRAADLALPEVLHAPLRHLGAQPQRGFASQLPHPLATGLALGGGEVAAGAGIGAGRGVRGARRLEDLPPGAVALVDEALRRQGADRGLVVRAALRLADDLAVPVQAQRRKVLQLALRGALLHSIEVLDPQVEGAAGAAREHPGQDRGAKVPQVQVAAGGGGVAARPGAGRGSRHARQSRERG